MRTIRGALFTMAIAGGLLASQKAMGADISYPFDAANSSATITHIADTSNTSFAPTVVTVLGANIKNAAPATPFLNNDVISTSTKTGPSSTNATASLYHSNTSTDMTIAMTGGTGVGQANVPGNAFSGPSELDTHIDALWSLTSPYSPGGQFPGINYQFPIGGIIGIGGNDHFIVSLTFYDTTGAGTDSETQTPIGSLNLDVTLSNPTSAPQAFAETLSGDDLINNGNPLPVGSEFEEVGDIIFKAKNDLSASSFDFTADTNTGALVYSTLPTGAQDFSLITADAVPLPSSVEMGLVAIGLMGLGRWVLSARRAADTDL